MKKQRLSEAQIVSILKQYDGGRDAMELCREYGISKATLYNWRKKYAGMDASHLKEMKALQEENRRLKPKRSSKKSCNAQPPERACWMV